jgi:hypothetical protein
MSYYRQHKTLLLYLIPVAALLLLAQLVHAHEALSSTAWWTEGDHARYQAMAEHPFADDPLVREAPYCWRILTPLIVSLLPFPTLTSFWIVTLIGLMGTTLALEWILAGLKLPTSAVLAGGCIFVLLGPATGGNFWDYAMVDPLALFCTTMLLGCAVHQRGPLLVVFAILGAFTKEITLLGVIFALVWAWRRHRSLLPWCLGALSGAIGVLMLLRVLIRPDNTWSLFYYFQVTADHFGVSISVLLLYTCFRLIEGLPITWGVLLIPAVLQLRHPPRFWRMYPEFALFLAGTMAQFFVAADNARLLVFGFPAMLAACCFELEYLAARWNCSRWMIWTPILLLQGYEWITFAGWPALENGVVAFDAPHNILNAGLLVLATGILAWLLLKRKSEAL